MLAGCTAAPEVGPPSPISARPIPAPEKPAPPEPVHEPSDSSRNMQEWLASVEQRLIAQGKMRTDRGNMIEVDTETLVQTFVAVALHDEYIRSGDRIIQQMTTAPLRRWDKPVLFQIEFGDSVGTEQRRTDRRNIARHATRLSSATGHPVTLAGSGGNFIVMILDEDERRAIAPRLSQLVPGIPPADIRALSTLTPQNFCTVFAYSRGGSPTYDHAVALIRAELPARMRQSCIHEELSQGMGLANDSPKARPSIFNDDQEFAYLTWLDEALLKMLYDPRLTPGMTEAEALPIIRRIAAEMIPPPSS